MPRRVLGTEGKKRTVDVGFLPIIISLTHTAVKAYMDGGGEGDDYDDV